MQNSPQDLRKKLLGRKGEELTCKYLKKKGYEIVARNYKTPYGEADIVARQGDTYCFVEVKTRETDAFGLPSEAVTARKRERYRKIAWHFCIAAREELSCRFDVASIYQGELEYIEGAFE